MWFLFVRPEVCPRSIPASGFLQIPPRDGHPCLRLYPSRYRADSGLSPVRNVRRRAHSDKTQSPKIGGLCFLEQYNLTQLSVTIFSFLHLTNQSFFEKTEENATLLFSFFAAVRQIQHTQPHHRSNHQTRVQEQMSAITGRRCLRVSIFDCDNLD